MPAKQKPPTHFQHKSPVGHSIQCILPPHLLREVIERGNEAQREHAWRAVGISEQIRGQRETSVRTATPAVIAEGQKQRTAPFPREAQEAMLKYLAFRHDDLPCLWVTEERQRLSYNGIGQDLARLRERAGLKGQIQDICHIFRRTAAANAEEAGVSPSHILAGFGWESPTMLNHYVAAKRLEQGKAVESFKEKDPLGKWLRG